MISIIVSSYNQKNYLKQCLDSILSQTYRDIEIRIVDDASMDGSQALIRSYCQQYSQCLAIFHKENFGVSSSRNEGVRKAKGEYITTLDGDDFYWNERKLEKELEAIDRGMKFYKKHCIAYSNTVLVDQKGVYIRKVYENGTEVEGNVQESLLVLKDQREPRDMLFRKELIQNSYFNSTQLPIYEDWDLKLRLAKDYPYVYSGCEGTAYRQVGNGLSRENIFSRLYWITRVFWGRAGGIFFTKATWLYSVLIKNLLMYGMKKKLGLMATRKSTK